MLINSIFTQPYCRIQNLVESHIAKRQTASVYLKTLESIGVLKELKVGREKLFIHPKFVHDAMLTRARSGLRNLAGLPGGAQSRIFGAISWD